MQRKALQTISCKQVKTQGDHEAAIQLLAGQQVMMDGIWPHGSKGYDTK
jgi:hypothetical protein